MDIHERRTKSFADFKEGKRLLYVISSSGEDARPSPMLKKVDDTHLAILLWTERKDALAHLAKLGDKRCEVREICYEDLKARLPKSGSGAREEYKIEVI